MGRIVKTVSQNTTRYYWYPGDRKDWIRAGIAGGVGLLTFGIFWLITRDVLVGVLAGTSATAAIAGINFGRRDARALAGFPAGARRAAVMHTGRAAWRATVEGLGGASAAILIVNLPGGGFAANWLLPVVPALIGALAHQAGMLWERAVAAPPLPPPAAVPAVPAVPARPAGAPARPVRA